MASCTSNNLTVFSSCVFRIVTQKTSKLRITGPFLGESGEHFIPIGWPRSTFLYGVFRPHILTPNTAIEVHILFHVWIYIYIYICNIVYQRLAFYIGTDISPRNPKSLIALRQRGSYMCPWVWQHWITHNVYSWHLWGYRVTLYIQSYT